MIHALLKSGWKLLVIYGKKRGGRAMLMFAADKHGRKVRLGDELKIKARDYHGQYTGDILVGEVVTFDEYELCVHFGHYTWQGKRKPYERGVHFEDAVFRDIEHRLWLYDSADIEIVGRVV